MIVDYDVESAWKGHEDFLAWLIATKRPEIYVEVGVYRGFSYFAACQMIKGLGLPTKAHGVDTWADGYCYTESAEDVYQTVAAHNAAHFDSFSALVRKPSVEAAQTFADRSIDISILTRAMVMRT